MVERELMDLVDWIESYCEADGKPIKLQPWQKRILNQLQKQADEKIRLHNRKVESSKLDN